ncbi:MAG: hypothetical protein ACOYEL_01515 [Saccharofermentanales bacterium]|jgi:ABC-2 type transport system permease protein
MKKWWILTKALVKGSDVFGLEMKETKKRKKLTLFSRGLDRTKKILLGVVIFAYIAFVFGINGYNIAKQLLAMGFDAGNPTADPIVLTSFQASLAQLYLPGFFMLLGMGFFYAAGIFFFAEDLDTLLALPLKPSTIVAAKLANLYIFSLVIPLALTLPAAVVLGYMLRMPLLYYLYAFLTLIFGAMIPMCIDAILILLMMRTAVFARSKDRFMIVTQVLMFVGIFAFVFSNMGSIDLDSELPTTGPVALQYIVPMSNRAIEAISLPQDPGSILKIISLIAVALGLVILLVLLSSRLYLRAARESRASSQAHKPMTAKTWQSLRHTTRDLPNMVSREFKILYRSPTFLMNILAFPIIMLVSMFGTMIFSFSREGKDLATLQRLMAATFASESRENVIPIIMMVVVGIAAFLSSTNTCMPTAISREGRGAGMLKSWPLKISTVFLAKLIVGGIVSLLAWLPIAVLTFAILPFSIYFQPTLLILFIFLPLTINNLALIIDLSKPYLEWNSEQQVAKQNMNIFKTMLMSLVVGGLLIGAVLLIQKLGGNLIAILTVINSGSILLFVISILLLATVGKKYYLERIN